MTEVMTIKSKEVGTLFWNPPFDFGEVDAKTIEEIQEILIVSLELILASHLSGQGFKHLQAELLSASVNLRQNLLKGV